jgi:hypothetical protein
MGICPRLLRRFSSIAQARARPGASLFGRGRRRPRPVRAPTAAARFMPAGDRQIRSLTRHRAAAPIWDHRPVTSHDGRAPFGAGRGLEAPLYCALLTA